MKKQKKHCSKTSGKKHGYGTRNPNASVVTDANKPSSTLHIGTTPPTVSMRETRSKLLSPVTEMKSTTLNRAMRPRPFVKQRATRSGGGAKKHLPVIRRNTGQKLNGKTKSPISRKTVTKHRAEIPGVESAEQHSAVKSNILLTNLPIELTQVLAKDHDSVMNQGKLPVLPASVTVHDILSQYREDKTRNPMSDATRATFTGFTSGLRDYFNEMLGTKLLYSVERAHVPGMLRRHANRPPCELFGSRHLLRLLSKLAGGGGGDVLAVVTAGMSEERVTTVRYLVNDLALYLVDNIQHFLSTHD